MKILRGGHFSFAHSRHYNLIRHSSVCKPETELMTSNDG